jgi:hypothetical protein
MWSSIPTVAFSRRDYYIALNLQTNVAISCVVDSPLFHEASAHSEVLLDNEGPLLYAGPPSSCSVTSRLDSVTVGYLDHKRSHSSLIQHKMYFNIPFCRQYGR